MTSRSLKGLGLILLLLIIAVVAYALNIVVGLHANAQMSGTIAGLELQGKVEVLRDARGVPHIRASNEHDLFFAQGYVEAADRGFQLDLLRRFVYGQLAEVLGSAALSADENARVVPVAQLARTQYDRLTATDRSMLQAFADGVNAAYARESTPVEFRVLAYKPRPWRAQDSLAVGFATTLDLIDSWNDILKRSGKPVPLSDPCYDVPVTQGLPSFAPRPGCPNRTALLRELQDPRPPIGSNEWATGASRNATGRALLANDPHLRLQVPGVWYLVDLEAPGFHVAGATLAGVPGVILGHNDRLAWGATNGTTTALSVFSGRHQLDAKFWRPEVFHVRFSGNKTAYYYRNRREFAPYALDNPKAAPPTTIVRWSAYEDPRSPLVTFDQLDHAKTIEDALRALRSYPGPTQNFVLADTSGRVAYQLAGEIPDDPAWGRRVHDSSDLTKNYPPIPFDRLPRVAASRNAIVWTANNKIYGPGYPYRLSAEFEPPYRAYRVAQMLHARKAYDVAYFTMMQLDTLSVAELELSKSAPLLHRWDGRFTADSRDATAMYGLRMALTSRFYSFDAAMIRNRNDATALNGLPVNASPQPWGSAGAIPVKHPLAALGLSFLNGTTLEGSGDAYTVHMQKPGFSQSFRAVWDVGNWDAGGISIPQGESGRSGSGHYTDEAADWEAGHLLPLPFTDLAVERATRSTLTLTP